ncbi:MAG: HAMP domain-containing protein [Candidatus Omnitrophica bacterium]|nr:HAMP domain-containing protein [Candidatus Omnitrophota bacterium]
MRKRRQFIVNKKLQFQYVSFAIVPLIVGAAFVYYLIYLMTMNQMAIPEIILYYLVPAMRRTNEVLMVIAPLALIGLFVATVLASHRLAGPLHRLDRELHRVASGDYSVRITFRKGDELSSLAHSLNSVLDVLEQKSKEA